MVAVKKLYSTAGIESEWKPLLNVQDEYRHNHGHHHHHHHHHRREEGSRQNRLAGFIFVCNKDTLPDLDRRIFGLPAHHAESVRAIRRGMPLFLFNYSSRCLCGVFEATSDGGLNLDPYAWENTEQTKFMKGPVSRYPAQVKVRLRIQRPPLDEETFRPVLDHFEGHKFRLELTRYQVQQLLRLFGAPDGGFFGGKVMDFHMPFSTCDCDSPRSASRSDFDCQSECSSKGTYNGEEECIEETPSEDIVLSDSMNLDFLSDKLDQIVLNDVVQEGMLYNATQMAGMPLNILGRNHTSLMNQYHIWNMNHSKGLDCAPKDHNEYHILRLNGNDPAVNNGLVNFGQNCSHHLLLEGGEGMFTIPLMPAEWQPLLFETHIPALAEPRDCTGFPVHMHKVSGPAESMRSDSCLSLKQCLSDEKIEDSMPSILERQMNGTASCLPSSLFVQLPAQSGSGKCMPVLPPDGKYAQPPVDHLELEEGEGDVAVMPHLFIQPSSFPVFLMPSMPRIVPIASPIELLHLEILQFARLTRPSAETILHVESAIDSVRTCVKMLWPEADVEVFGSFASGLCLQHSDVDLAIVDAPFVPSMVNMSISQISAFLLKEIGSFLKIQKWCMSYNVIDTASVPVLKCCYQPLARLPDSSLSMPSISIDITIGGIRGTAYEWNQAYRFGGSGKLSKIGKFQNQHTGGGAREYVLQKIQELPALAPLVLLLKSFLHHKGLSNVYLGGLGSFSLTLLITFYLERAMEGLFEDFHTESFLPKHFDMQNLENGPDYNSSLGEYYVQRAAKAVEKVLALSESSGIHCLGTLLLGFLNFFGSEDLTCQKIVLKGLDGSPGGKRQRWNRHIALWIDDPLHPGINVGAGSFGMCHVQDSFREMLQVLIYRKLPVVPLCCSKIDCQDLAAFGQFPQLRQLILQAESW